MSRVEETNKALTELKDTVIEALKTTSDSHAAIAHVITFEAGVNEEIAKNLAQLADDIHFIKEAMAKEIEGVESVAVKYKKAAESYGPKCLDCRYSDTMDYVDKDGIRNRDVDWCTRKHQKIDFYNTPVCGYFEYKEQEAES